MLKEKIMEPKHVDKTLKLVVIGERKCGKTALIVRFLTGKFIHEYATGEDVMYPHTLPQASHEIRLKIIDISQKITSKNLLDADGIVIVYAVNNSKSFRKAKDLLILLETIVTKHVCVTIVANKADMWHYRCVMRSDGEYLAKKYGCKYFEISALNDPEGVDRMFNVIAKLIHDKNYTYLPGVKNITLRKNITNLTSSSSVILIDEPPPDNFEGRQRSRSLQLPKEKKHNSQKSPILFRKILKTWSNSSLSRSKSTEKLF